MLMIRFVDCGIDRDGFYIINESYSLVRLEKKIVAHVDVIWSTLTP